MKNERSLVAFTLLTQTAVGGFWTMELIYKALSPLGHGPAEIAVAFPVIVLGGAIAVAAISSLAHLGSPRNAWLAVSNLRTSWLSREIILFAAFAIAGGFVAIGHWTASASLLHPYFVLFASAIGALLIVAISNVYRLETHPAWNSVRTTLAFLLTSVLLGGSLTGTIILVESPPMYNDHGLSEIIMLTAVLQMILHVPRRPKVEGETRTEWESLYRNLLPRMILRTGLLCIAAILFGIEPFIPSATLALWITGTLLLCASELLGRTLFYDYRIRIGL